MNYACLQKQQFETPPYQIIPIRYEDIFLIKEWRNEQMDILRQDVLLTDAMQEAYYEKTIFPSFALPRPDQILFSYLKNHQFIGYGGIVHIDWEAKQGEVSFLVDTMRTKIAADYEADFSSFLKLIKEAAFNDLHFHRLYTETFDIRPLHIATLEKSGFLLEKRMKNWVTINEKPTDALIHGCVQND